MPILQWLSMTKPAVLLTRLDLPQKEKGKLQILCKEYFLTIEKIIIKENL